MMRTWISVLVICGLVGGASGLTIDATKAQIRTVGGENNGVWNLWSGGEVGDYLDFAGGGEYKIAVTAYGSPAGGVWPQMSLRLNGATIDNTRVASAKPRVYVFTVKLHKGSARVAVTFDNDAVIEKEDRNLYLAKIEITPPQGVDQPRIIPKSQAISKENARHEKDERAALKQADIDIEKNRKRDAEIRIVDATGKPIGGATVKIRHIRHDFLFGCNIYMFDRFGKPEENALYKKRFRELFNAATTGFYWASYEPVKGKPRYEYTDAVVKWAREHRIRLKGHPLLWDHRASKPKWSGGKQPPVDVQKKRVFDIMQRYSGKIEFWEVVNEPSHLPRFKIDTPYRWARQADKNAYLIINDYYVMANGYPPFFKLLKKSIASNVPFDGIGIQAHEPRTMRFPLETCKEILDKYATLGKELHVTEFTPTSSGAKITGSHVGGVWDEDAQADYAEKFFRICFAHEKMVALTWWDLCERGAWLKGGGLLRKDLSPKKVYTVLKKLIHEEWSTDLTARSGPEGRAAFRGFHGAYTATVSAGDKTAKTEFHLGKEPRSQSADKKNVKIIVVKF
ncbi:MAG: endo-1,4-beta-xylanase [Phycisphaerae bacterium]|jgi:GH35 family endo-1,4-beta-xylanase|nr:endo-1,4-beta-xylanase [Phycisphaerae bacterium]